MNAADLFVGVVSVGLGVIGLFAAGDSRETNRRTARIRWLEQLVGRPISRAIYGLLGLFLIGLGAAIAS